MPPGTVGGAIGHAGARYPRHVRVINATAESAFYFGAPERFGLVQEFFVGGEVAKTRLHDGPLRANHGVLAFVTLSARDGKGVRHLLALNFHGCGAAANARLGRIAHFADVMHGGRHRVGIDAKAAGGHA